MTVVRVLGGGGGVRATQDFMGDLCNQTYILSGIFFSSVYNLAHIIGWLRFAFVTTPEDCGVIGMQCVSAKWTVADRLFVLLLMALPILLCVHSSQLGVELVSLSARIIFFFFYHRCPLPPHPGSLQPRHTCGNTQLVMLAS